MLFEQILLRVRSRIDFICFRNTYNVGEQRKNTNKYFGEINFDVRFAFLWVFSSYSYNTRVYLKCTSRLLTERYSALMQCDIILYGFSLAFIIIFFPLVWQTVIYVQRITHRIYIYIFTIFLPFSISPTHPHSYVHRACINFLASTYHIIYYIV